MRWLWIWAWIGCAWGQGNWREAEIDGRRIRYEVVQGEAIWQGDIILGPVEEFGKTSRASAVVSGQNARWTGNTIPYVLNDDIPERARVEGAIAHWNARTPIRLVPRQNEANYLELRRRTTGSCSSSVGMIGGRQFINVTDDCSLGSMIHEIGHTVGLFHTQSREDRDLFIRVKETAIESENLSQYRQTITNSDDVGAYPYDSIMHYSVTGFALPGNVAMETIPAGIPLGQRAGLTASDIDTVVRMQGERPGKTVIASNPDGLDVIVDGRAVRAPAEFDWAPGSRHTIGIADVAVAGADLWFGRWSDFGERTHTITASPETTVYTAHMRRMYRLPLVPVPGDGGQVLLRPPAEAGFIPDGRLLELEAAPAPGFAFTNWSGFGFFSTHGSANPIRFAMTSSQLAYNAGFTRSPITTVTTNPPGLRIQVDGTAYTAPRQFIWTAGTRHDISVETLTQTTLGGAASHVWREWSDSGGQRHAVTATPSGGTITAAFDTSYQVLTTVSPSASGRIVIDPAPASGFLPAGAPVSILATPNPGFTLAAWSGDLAGGDPQRNITISGPLDLRAQFAQPAILTAAGFVNGASYFGGPVAPGQIVTLFGVDLGPPELAGLTLTPQRRVATTAGDVRVLFDGTPAPVLYASSGQVGAIVPFNVTGKSFVRVQLEYRGRLTNLLTLNVAATAPGLFTANATGRGGGAFLNENGSVNTESNPAARGSIVVLYATGFGAMRPALNDGELAAAPYPQPVAPFKVRIAGRECEILYGGAAPGLVAGLMQLNVRVPNDIAPGIVPVSVEAGGVGSARTVSIAVR